MEKIKAALERYRLTRGHQAPADSSQGTNIYSSTARGKMGQDGTYLVIRQEIQSQSRCEVLIHRLKACLMTSSLKF